MCSKFGVLSLIYLTVFIAVVKCENGNDSFLDTLTKGEWLFLHQNNSENKCFRSKQWKSRVLSKRMYP